MELRILPTSFFSYCKKNNVFKAQATAFGIRINPNVEYIKLRNNKTKKTILFQKNHTCKLAYYYRPSPANQEIDLSEKQTEILLVIEKPKFYNL
tara:strand:+ start:8012 stop:8293 length:282 start_codon:yes stop_codon:yes gene_type:complete